jgi:hypothetical protein
MLIFSEEVSHTPTNSPFNIIHSNNFQEVFFDIFEVEINDKKYTLEKISQYRGNPIISIPVIIEGVEVDYRKYRYPKSVHSRPTYRKFINDRFNDENK